MESFREHVESVLQDISAACQRAGRPASEVRLITVTKTLPDTSLPVLLSAGLREFGENRWQQARDKLARPESGEAIWHFIGRLQGNKVKYIVPRFDWIHSLDSAELAEAVNERAESLGKTVNGLLQVNISGEASKGGIEPEAIGGVLRRLQGLKGLQIRGLMTMAPNTMDIEETRPVFRGLADLLKDLGRSLAWPELQELSMGMSNDFSVAIEEGATMVRIGRRIAEAAAAALSINEQRG